MRPPRRWPRGERPAWLRSALLLTGAGLISQLLLLVGTLVVVAFYTPAEVGAVASFLAFLAIVSVAAAMRYELSLPLIRGRAEALGMLRFCLALVIVTSAIAGVAAIVAGPAVVRALDLPTEMRALRFIVFPALVVMGASVVFTQWVTRRRRYRPIARARVIQAAGQVALQGSAGVAGTGVAGLTIATASSFGAGATALARPPLRALHRDREPVDRRAVRALARRYWQLPTFSTGAVICHGLALGSTPILLGAMYDLRVAGLYALAQRVVSVPMRTVGEAVARVYFGDAAALLRARRAEIRHRFRQTVGVLAGVGLPLALGIVAFAPAAFALVFGEEWREAGEFARVLAVLLVWQFLAVPVNQTMTIFGRLDVSFALAVGTVLLTVGPLVVAHAAGASPLTAIAAFSLGGALSYAVAVVVSDRLARDR